MTTNDQSAWDSQDETQNYGSGAISIDDLENGHITDRGFSDDLNDNEFEGEDDDLDTDDSLASDDDDDLADDDDDISDDEFDEDIENQSDDTEGGGNLNT